MKRARIDWEVVRGRLRASESAREAVMAESPERIDAAYRRRAVKLAEEEAGNRPASAAIPVLIFRLAKERYAIELRDVAETLPFTRCTPVPGSAPYFPGVIGVRGELRALLDLGRLLGLPGDGGGDAGFVLILRGQGAQVGLKVDGIEELRVIRTEDISVSGHGPCMKGIIQGTMLLLNVEAVLAEIFSKEESLAK